MSRTAELLPQIRSEFPRADTDASGKKRIFFDAGAGSLVLRRAAEAEAASMVNYSANLGEPSWESGKAEEVIRQGRRSIRDLLGAESEDCIVSGESATSLFFRLTYALGKEMKRDENVVTTEYDHYANVSALLELERRGAVKEARLARFNPSSGSLDYDHLASLVDSKTRLVSVAGVSNALGSRTDLQKVAKIAKDVGAYFVVDAVHMVPHMSVNVLQLDCDFLIFSGYKVFTRRGSFMYGKKELLHRLSPYKLDTAPDKVPDRWEWGTLDQSLFGAFSAVADYLVWLGGQTRAEFGPRLGSLAGRAREMRAAMLWIEEYEKSLSRAMLGGVGGAPSILDIPNITFYGPRNPEERTPTFTFNINGADSREVAKCLWDEHAVATLSDDFYSRAMKTYEVGRAVRASLAHYNTTEEIAAFLRGLEKVAKKLARQ